MLKDLKLKAEALNSLKLPVIVKAGFVGTITIKVLFKDISPIVTMFCFFGFELFKQWGDTSAFACILSMTISFVEVSD